LIRNGPGGVDIYGENSCKHLFDGPGLLQSFKINNGAVTYTSKFIESHAFTRNIAAQRLVVSEFGTVAALDPCQTIFSR
jgi:carotenoid cleavage dioxygenase-like enzyme